MKETFKKCLAAFCAGAMAVALVPAGIYALQAGSQTVSAERGGRLLYYVDCGALSANADGTGPFATRGTGAYPSKERTPFMTAYGIEFGTAEGGLYNSVTDKTLGEDEITHKTWGYNGGYNDNGDMSWRYDVPAGTPHKLGFEHVRYVNEKDSENDVLTYKFEVLSSDTDLTVTFGSRRSSQCNANGFTAQVNGNVSENGGGTQQCYAGDDDNEYTFTGVKGVEESGKYYVTLEIGTEQDYASVSYILISTADYELPVTADFEEFLNQGSTTVHGELSVGGAQDFALDEENQEKLNSAQPFDKVQLTATYSGKSYTDTVTVLPKTEDLMYLIDTGADHAQAPFSQDQKYETSGYGYLDENGGSCEWKDSVWNESIREGDTGGNTHNASLTYRFDITEEGAYKVIFGTATPNGWWGRPMTLSVLQTEGVTNGTSESANPYDGQKDGWKIHNFCVTADVAVTAEKTTLDVKIEATKEGEHDGVNLAYILVYKTEKAPEHTHTISPDWSSDDNRHWHEASCGQEEHREDVGDHDWDSGVVTKPATCTEEGVKTFTCTTCQKTKTESIGIDSTAHSFDMNTWAHDASGHWHPATCGHETEKNGFTEHTWDNGNETKAPSCTEKGVKTFTCTCGETRTEDIEMTEHTWDNGTVTKAATCTEKGVKTFTCTACKTTRTEDIETDATAHTFDTEHWTSDENNHWHAATCPHDTEKSGEEGHSFEGDTCTVCGYKKASTEDPGTDPGTTPGTDPGTTPGTDPGTGDKPQGGGEEKGGCGAVAFGGAFGAILLGGVSAILLRKRKQD